jgi:hypothetical protein
MRLAGAMRVCVFNWDEMPETIEFRLPKKSRVTDFWSGEDLGSDQGPYKVENLAPRSARLFSVNQL